MTSDGSQVTADSHDIDQEGQVTVIDIGTVKGQHLGQLTKHSSAGSLNSKDLENLDELVRVGTSSVNTRNGEDRRKMRATGLQNPVLAKRVGLAHQ
jgi:hypothetical protein